MGRVIGIDLGTTNSCVALVEDGKPQVIPNQEGSRTTPSIVALAQNGEWLVGLVAKRQAVTNPRNTVFAAKRLIGRRFDSPEVASARKVLPYDVVASESGDAWVELGARGFSPPEISAHVLRKLAEAAQDYLGEDITDAVITVPAYFNDSQRQATRDAGRIAGLNVLRIINEPTAAAVAYGLTDQPAAKVAVYDLGGGTFDISVLSIGDGVVDVLSTSGDTFLGGEDFDQRILAMLAERFEEETGVDLLRDRAAVQRLREASEKAKCDLSSTTATQIELPFIAANASGPKHLSMRLTRSQVEGLTRDLIDRTLGPCKRALSDAGLRTTDIDQVLLVGGQTRMPLIQSMVTDFFMREPSTIMNPDEVVACGAAIQAGILHGEVEEVLLLDVTPLSLGVETAGGIFTTIIPRNTSVPVTANQVFSTSVDNQSMVSIHVLQGERPLAKDNHSLAHFDLLDIPPAPRGVPQIEVVFSIDSDGIVSVTARELGTGRQQSIRVSASGGLTGEEIERIIRESEARAEEDLRRKEVVDLKNRAKGLLYTAERSVEEYRQVLGDDALTHLEHDMRVCRSALDRDNTSVEELQLAVAGLEKSAHRLTEVLYAELMSEVTEYHPDGDSPAENDR